MSPIRRPLKSIYQYIDYREFLKDSYAEKKESKGMTLRDFAIAAGFNAHSFLTNVIKGKRALTLESADKMARGLGLTPAERDYLGLLVRFEAAKSIAEKNEIFDRMRAYLPKDITHRISPELFDVLREPHIFTIREMVALPNFREDPDWIAKKLNPPVPSRQVKTALTLLLQTGLLKRDTNNKLVQASPDLTTGPEIRSLAVCLYHKRILELAATSIDQTPAHLRDLSSMTLNLSKSEFEFIKKRTAEFRAEILDFLKVKRNETIDTSTHERERTLYYLNLQFFNAMEIPW